MADRKNIKPINAPHRSRGKKQQLIERIKKHLTLSRDLLFRALFILIIATFTVILTNPTPENFEAASVANRTIRSDKDISVRDHQATTKARLEAFNSATPLFILDEKIATQALNNIRHLFQSARLSQKNGWVAPPQEITAQFCRLFQTGNCLALLSKSWEAGFNEALESRLSQLTVELMVGGLIDASIDVDIYRGRSIEVSRLDFGNSLVSFDSVLTIPRAKRLIEARAYLADDVLGGPELLVELTTAVLRPNLLLDQNVLQARRLQAASDVPEVVHHVAKGEVVVNEGQVITPKIDIILAALKAKSRQSLWVKRSMGLMVLLVVFLAVTQTLTQLVHTHGVQTKELLLLSSLILVYIIMAWWAGRISPGLSQAFDYVETHTVFMAMPIPTATMLGAIFLGSKRAVFLCFLGSFLGAIVAPVDTLTAFIYICNGCLVTIWCLRHINERGRLILAAALVSIINCMSLLGLTLMEGDVLSKQFLFDLYAAAGSGLLSGILASGLIPLIELLFGLTTNLKLLELGNLNRPLLRDLMLAAPGTYHHSVIVGSMVEAAAEAIGANPHLARVGAYYHDIGKIKKPLYFVENQLGENKHETLTPTLSALVLVGHVKEGVELALANNLPSQVVDIVEQHHGTSLMSYFYHKAVENRNPNTAEINQGDFRYPGPKPASKEAGLVMLADICEAATRTLTEPTPAKIHDLVRTLVNRVFDDGQLDASELVLKDVTETIKVFNNILNGIYHHRIAYPGTTKEAVSEQEAKSKVIYGPFPTDNHKRLPH
jgi:putative nucleotidyltransferase with HDIG domain